MTESYDLIVIGSGPAGYVAAERAGEAGRRVLLVEREPVLGGVCLNWGCIPTKTLLNCAKIFHYAGHGQAFGVSATPQFDFAAAQARKQKVVGQLNVGVAGLMKRAKVTVVTGQAQLVDATTVAVGDQRYSAAHILVCSGSRPSRPPIPGLDLAHVVDSTGILALERLPQSLVVIGGGVIGLEFAHFFASVGVAVTVVEMLDQIAGATDLDCARTLRQALEQHGITIHTQARVTAITAEHVAFTDRKGQDQQAAADCVLVATGRTPNVEGLGLEQVGVALERGRIVIDERCRTNVPSIWAAGDCTGKALLAHVASRQAEVVVAAMAGGPDRMRYHAVPAVIYTTPEVACVGLSEAEAKAQGRAVLTAKLPMSVSGRFLAEHDDRGLVKVVVDAQTRALIGVHMVGATCSEMIFGAAAMIESQARVDEIKQTIFPHPTVSEVIREAMFALR